MQQTSEKLLMLRNRLEKVFRHISRQAKKQNISCYRIYDHDLPEFPFIIEMYDDKLYVSEYKRKHSLTEELHQQWLQSCLPVISEVVQVPMQNIFLKVRRRKEGRLGQYEKLDEVQMEFVVEENSLKFIVNLSDYLDTGLFLDHRITRQMVMADAKEKQVLNLFCYTGSFSIYAAAGGASKIVSVDLSKTYLSWAERNMELNFPFYNNHSLIHADATQYIKTEKENSFDLIVLDPPTFSNSKRMDDFFDVQKDHVALINDCLRILSPGGKLFFSTNYTKFALDELKLDTTLIKNITKATTPFDFTGKLHRQCYLITK